MKHHIFKHSKPKKERIAVLKQKDGDEDLDTLVNSVKCLSLEENLPEGYDYAQDIWGLKEDVLLRKILLEVFSCDNEQTAENLYQILTKPPDQDNLRSFDTGRAYEDCTTLSDSDLQCNEHDFYEM